MINGVNNTNLIANNAVNYCHVKNDKKIGFGAKREARYFLRWLSKNFSSPQQKAVIGLTALCTQPFIDLHNRHIKKEDRSVVVAKTISKIIVGTCVGIAIRHYSIKMIKQFTKSVRAGQYSQCLLPKKILKELRESPKNVSQAQLTNYRNGLGTLIGTLCCLVTNFVIDAPLTKMMTNYLNENVFSKEKTNAK